jgi:rare lipoprotein A
MPANFKPSVVATLLANGALLFAGVIGSDCRAATSTNGADEGSHMQAAEKSLTKSAEKPAQVKPPVDVSGKTRLGKASFYANRFGGRIMADGNRMSLQGSNAASRTLPLGTTAKVTNLQTGQSAVVTIQDRGPYVNGRIVDLSPATAQQIGITRKEGIAKVVVAPIAVPLPNGDVKLGDAAADNSFLVALNDLRVKDPRRPEWGASRRTLSTP